MDTVHEYIQTILLPDLNDRHVPTPCCYQVIADIEEQLRQRLAGWPHDPQVLALLEPSREEASHYAPSDAPLPVRMLVHSAIRNSLIEDLHADDPYTPSFKHEKQPYLSEQGIADITQRSILFWYQTPPGSVLPPIHPLDIRTSHPITYQAFRQLSTLSKQDRHYTPVPKTDIHLNLIDVDHASTALTDRNTRSYSGYDPRIDAQLAQHISDQLHPQGLFFTPAFKFLTRNHSKLWDIIELLLGHNATVLTFNYCLQNGYVSRRKPLLPVAHTTDEVAAQHTNLRGLSRRHRQLLQGR